MRRSASAPNGRAPSAKELFLTQALVDILYTGSVYALFAFGYALTYGVTGTFNVAHPIAVVTGALAASHLLSAGHAMPIAVLGGAAAGGLVGIGVDRLVLWPQRLRPAGPLGENQALIAGAALWVLFAALSYRFLSGPAVGASWFGSLHLAGTVVSRAAVNAAAGCLVALCAAWLLLRRTRFGIGVRGVASNLAAARASGVSAEWLITQSIFVACALGALAGIAIQLVSGEALPALRLNEIQLASLAAVMLGGLDSLSGSVLAAFGVAAVQFALRSRFGQDDRALISAMLVLVALALLPRGLMASRALRPRSST